LKEVREFVVDFSETMAGDKVLDLGWGLGPGNLFC
jgi:hypothetical protein